jgi:hypothetical protein
VVTRVRRGRCHVTRRRLERLNPSVRGKSPGHVLVTVQVTFQVTSRSRWVGGGCTGLSRSGWRGSASSESSSRDASLGESSRRVHTVLARSQEHTLRGNAASSQAWSLHAHTQHRVFLSGRAVVVARGRQAGLGGVRGCTSLGEAGRLPVLPART